jgi:predicted RNase H-like HicB family nuclease
MLTDYINAAMRQAKYEILPDDQSYYGEIPGFDGVFASASSLEECRAELMSTLEDWILFRVSRHLPLPVVDGLALAVGAPV